jgi:HAE1 family hydrophobic/amphiphilic exporter-1
MFLRPPDRGSEGKKRTFKQKITHGFNTGYDKVTEKYIWIVKGISRRWWIVLLIVAAFSGLLYGLMKSTPTSFVPSEDMGTVFASVSLPPSSTLERVQVVNHEVDSIMHTIPQILYAMEITGRNQIAGAGSSYGMLVMRLIPWDSRPGVSDVDVINQLIQKTSHIRGASITFMQQPTITGFSASGGFTFQIQDRAAHSYNEFYKVGTRFLDSLSARPEIQYAISPFNPRFPQYSLNVNVAKCTDAGVNVSDLLSTMQIFY